MIRQYLIIVFSFTYITCFAQTNSKHVVNDAELMQSQKWGLDKYVFCHAKYSKGQTSKPVLDFDAIDNWTGLSSDGKITLSPNGQFFVYGIENVLNYHRLDTVVVQSTTNNWRAIIPLEARSGFFSADSKYYVFQDKDELCFLRTAGDERHSEKNVKSYKVNSKNDWIAWQLKNNDLVLRNLITGKEQRYPNVSSYNFDFKNTEWFSCQVNNDSKDLIVYNLLNAADQKFSSVKSFQFLDGGKYLVLNKGNEIDYVNLIDKTINTAWSAELATTNIKSFILDKEESHLLVNTGQTLDYVDFSNGQKKTIWSGIDSTSTIGSLAFDETGNQVVIVVKDASLSNAIWYWKNGMSGALLKVNNRTPEIEQSMLLTVGASFTDNGNYVRVTLQPFLKQERKPAPDAIQLDVWSYQDIVLQSTQPYLKETKSYSALFDIAKNKVIFLENDFKKLGAIRGDYALIDKAGSDIYGDRFWEKGYYNDSTWLISLKDNSRFFLPTKSSYNSRYFSPDGKYLVYFDAIRQCNYFSLALATGKLVNISVGVPAWQLGVAWSYLRTPEKPSVGSGIKLSLKEGGEFLVYDNYGDIWQLNYSGKKPPINLTNGYGRSHHIEFNLLLPSGGAPDKYIMDYGKGPFISKDTLLLSAFNTKTKLYGFYRKVLSNNRDPELLSIEPCYIEMLRDGSNGMYPIKASNANIWIVNRQSAVEAPNYFVTHDFKTFKQLTFLQPHKNYNWLRAELHSFKQLDGTISQGVLYKPENFDPSKKYPVIISFYGYSLSNRLNQFLAAEYIWASAIFDNPAWMVSHGYLVFVPDIYFIKDQWGPSTANTVDGAARYLAQLPYVDCDHVAACGHSNSGRFGYYLLNHSHSFAAMVVGSGFTGGDVLSGALSLDPLEQGRSCLEVAENSAYGTALGNIWQNKNRWIDHIAPLQTDRATSPFLLFHNKHDGDDVRLAIELFIAFRRLEKKAWWLQYDNGAHSVEGDDARDWTIRFTQFFDHYLKNAPAPRWMTQGIPYKLKGIEPRYELDASGSCAMQGKTHCYVCEAWNKQYKRTPAMFEKEIKDWELDKDLKEELDRKTKAERAKLDKEQLVEDKKIVNILKYGYPEDKKKSKSN